MLTEQQLKANARELHDLLSEVYYAGLSGLTKVDFDTQHADIWRNLETALIDAGYKQPPKPRLVFTATPPGEALGNRLKNVEDFLVEKFG